MTVAGVMLATTGYKGAELVYRHGLGVIPMQAGMIAGHNHSHGGEGHGTAEPAQLPVTETHDENHGHGGSEHHH